DALRFVLSKENAFPGGRPGFLHNPAGGPTHGPMYGHGFATLFLGEVYGMVHEKELRQEVHDKLRRAVRLILDGQNVEGGWRNKPHVGFGRPDMHYFYGHYYAVQAMWTAGGTYWSEWYPYIRDELLAQQSPDGSWADQIDPHYATAMACIILQVPNNYLPILQ